MLETILCVVIGISVKEIAEIVISSKIKANK